MRDTRLAGRGEEEKPVGLDFLSPRKGCRAPRSCRHRPAPTSTAEKRDSASSASALAFSSCARFSSASFADLNLAARSPAPVHEPTLWRKPPTLPRTCLRTRSRIARWRSSCNPICPPISIETTSGAIAGTPATTISAVAGHSGRTGFSRIAAASGPANCSVCPSAASFFQHTCNVKARTRRTSIAESNSDGAPIRMKSPHDVFRENSAINGQQMDPVRGRSGCIRKCTIGIFKEVAIHSRPISNFRRESSS